jgi:methionyl aminopeptidase
MVYYKSQEEIELIRASCLIVSKTLALVGSLIKPGVSAAKVDKEAESMIRDFGAYPTFKGYGGFPGSLCVSVNEEVVHGIPYDTKFFKEGDLVSVDCGANINGFHGDSAYTFIIEGASEEHIQLCRITNESLYRAIAAARLGNYLGDIGFAVQDFAERKHKYGVVRELVGHGIGKELHESPQVPNYGKAGKGLKLKEGLVIAIEPMINLGTQHVRTAKDGWSVITADKKPSAHYEHTVAITHNGADVLSDHSFLENSIRNNVDLVKPL